MKKEAGEEAPEKVLTALEWLESLAESHADLADLEPEHRRRLREAAGRIAFPDRAERRALAVKRKQLLREKVRRRDDAALNSTSNRAMKRALRFPVAPEHAELSEKHRLLLSQQASSVEQIEDGQVRLEESKGCYVCKSEYVEVHHHYDSMCPECAAFNWAKRNQTADLRGRFAVVTGARVKIGFEACLLLLRAGATVVATTRFPRDAARRFAEEADFTEWSDRLRVHGVDFRHTPSVEALAAHLCESLPQLDFLIHNACQTVRRPPAYYAHMMEGEESLALPAAVQPLVDDHERLIEEEHRGGKGAADLSLPTAAAEEVVGLTRAAALSQLDLLEEGDLAHLFPAGIKDGEGQQLDLRAGNSWRMELADVPTVELLEVQLVNSIAPFVLTSRLKGLMCRTDTRDKHIVNVSAMEGQFYRWLKTTRHPHTNMAKAALNMMTRTSAPDFVQSGIHMNSVDTGWVTDEDPFEYAVAKEFDQRFAPPLDSIDGAARVLDPIFNGFNTGKHCWGQFLKDYVPTRW